MKKLFIIVLTAMPLCLNAMEFASVSPLRDLINQFRNLYLPVVQLNLDEVVFDEVPGIVCQLEQARRMLDRIADQVSKPGAVISI